MPVVAQTTSLPYANRSTGDPGSPTTLCNEVNTTPREVPAETEADIPTGLPADNHAAATAKAVAPPIAQAIVHCPTSATDPIASKHPTGTPELYWCQTHWQCHNHQPTTQRFPVYRESVRWPDSLLHPTPASHPRWNKADDGQDRSWCSSQHHPLEQVPHPLPRKLNKSRFPKANVLLNTAHTWLSHDGSPKPVLGHFVGDIQHASEPRMYPTQFYMFKDAMSPQILLSYITLKRLVIIAFKVPNLTAMSQVDNIDVSTTLNLSGMRKTAKAFTFWDPLIDATSLPCSGPTPYQLPWHEKDCFPQGELWQFFTCPMVQSAIAPSTPLLNQ